MDTEDLGACFAVVVFGGALGAMCLGRAVTTVGYTREQYQGSCQGEYLFLSINKKKKIPISGQWHSCGIINQQTRLTGWSLGRKSLCFISRNGLSKCVIFSNTVWEGHNLLSEQDDHCKFFWYHAIQEYFQRSDSYKLRVCSRWSRERLMSSLIVCPTGPTDKFLTVL